MTASQYMPLHNMNTIFLLANTHCIAENLILHYSVPWTDFLYNAIKTTDIRYLPFLQKLLIIHIPKTNSFTQTCLSKTKLQILIYIINTGHISFIL